MTDDPKIRSTWDKVHCPKCNKVLCEVRNGSMIVIKCPRCNLFVRYPAQHGEIVPYDYKGLTDPS